MAKNKVHFGNEAKARDFAEKQGGRFNENKGNTEKPFTVSFHNNDNNQEHGYDFDSDLNGNGTHWHTSEDL
ncbi:hypothetical protein [Sphingobacterium kyonggiense]